MKFYFWLISFVIMFTGTAVLCVICSQLHLYPPLHFKMDEIYELALLTGILCFLFVFVTLPVLSFLKGKTAHRRQEEAFYVTGALIVLQAVTLLLGYTESSFSHGKPSSFFYYYSGGVDYSWAFIITGNLTVCIVSSLYASYKWNKKTMEETGQIGQSN